ncbi:MAG: hypothetical protein U0Q22_16010 [Acidimicrobiales bacterium]
MRHVQLTIANIALGPRPLPLRHGTLQVVERDGQVDWEIVLHTIETEPVARAVHPLTIEVVTGANDDGRLTFDVFTGDAILVRTVENSVVFRGNGDLTGFDPAMLG